jgi:hypothetical protein
MLTALHSSTRCCHAQVGLGSSNLRWLRVQMKQCPSWEADSRSADQDIPLMFWKPEVDYNIYNAPALIPVLSQINPNTRKFAAWCRETPSIMLYNLDQVPNIMAYGIVTPFLRNVTRLCMTSGFYCDADEICALLGYCAALSSNSVPTFRINL